MTQNQQIGRKPGTPGALSRWIQRTMNARTNRKIRRGRGRFMGMDVLILNTVGRQSGLQRETPLAWFADGENAWLIVASGGGSQHPDWYVNLMAHPDRASIELPGGDSLPVTRIGSTDRTVSRRGRASPPPSRATRSTRANPTGSTR